MTYRSDEVALSNRKQQLEQQLGELRAKIQAGKDANKVVDSTVKELEEPSPVPLAGISATDVISTPPVTPTCFKASRTNGCRIFSTVRASSVRE